MLREELGLHIEGFAAADPRLCSGGSHAAVICDVIGSCLDRHGMAAALKQTLIPAGHGSPACNLILMQRQLLDYA
jgi:hypothetical protein